jgi:uncharacterized protein YeeX (DUF496 family)
MGVKVMRIDRINEIERKYSKRTQPVTNSRVEGVQDNYRQFQEHLHREMSDEEKKKNKNKKKKSLLFYPDTLIRDDINYNKVMYTDLAKNSKKHLVKKDTFELFAERNSKIKKESKLKPRYFR